MRRLLLISAWCALSFAALVTLVIHGIYGYVLSGMALCLAAAIIWMTVVFFIAKRANRLDVADAAWSVNFIIIALICVWFNRDHLRAWSVQVIVLVVLLIWAARLAFHIVSRIKHTPSQDARYTNLQKTWKQSWGIEAYFKVFIAQAVLATIVSLPVIHTGLWHTEPPRLLASIGASVAMIGIGYESIADSQLRRFLSGLGHKGTLLMTGLRRYSQYPNYFGELCVWWGMTIVAFDTKYGWVGIIGALTITYLLRYVSGVPLAERSARTKIGWATYARRTNLLIPGPPKINR